MWSEGTIRIPDAKDKGKNTVCHYWVKHYEEPSETYGINGGRISKLMINVCIWCRSVDRKINQPRRIKNRA